MSITSSRDRADISVTPQVDGLGSFFVDDILYRVVKPFDEIVDPIFLSLKRTG
jgi:hypothetical protein